MDRQAAGQAEVSRIKPRLFLPCTDQDFALINRLMWVGTSNEEILSRLRNRNWRSEMSELLESFRCALCNQIPSPRICHDCGAPL